MTDDYSSAEIVRVLKAIQAEVTETRREMSTNHAAVLRQIEDQRAQAALLYVRQDVYERDRKLDAATGAALAEKVHSVTSLKDWAFRLVVGTIVLALMGLVLYTGGSVPQ